MKTKMLTSALVAALMVTGAAAAADLTAKPSVHHVYLDGQPIAPAGYEIADSNYFKLRDLAAVLNGSGKQFNVSWDEAAGAIALTSGEAYAAVGGELAPGDGAVKTAKPSTATVYKDGAALPLTGYEVADNNYYKLRDAAAAFGVEVKWDEATQRVDLITTGDGSTVAPTPEQPVAPTPENPTPPAPTPEYKNVITPEQVVEGGEAYKNADAVRVKIQCYTVSSSGVASAEEQEKTGFTSPVVTNIPVQLWLCVPDQVPVKLVEGISNSEGKITFTVDIPVEYYLQAFDNNILQYLAGEEQIEKGLRLNISPALRLVYWKDLVNPDHYYQLSCH